MLAMPQCILQHILMLKSSKWVLVIICDKTFKFVFLPYEIFMKLVSGVLIFACRKLQKQKLLLFHKISYEMSADLR